MQLNILQELFFGNYVLFNQGNNLHHQFLQQFPQILKKVLLVFMLANVSKFHIFWFVLINE